MSTERTIEQEIQAKGLTAPRITPADIEASIFSEHSFIAQDAVYATADRLKLWQAHHEVDTLNDKRPWPGGSLALLTIYILVLRNGFTVIGESACASAENFDAEIGRMLARQNAVDKIWSLMGYELRSKLANKAAHSHAAPHA